MDSKRYYHILERQGATASGITADEIKTGLQANELASKLADASDPNAVAALDRLVARAQEFGLTADEFAQAMADVKEQLSLESSAIARHEHTKAKADAGMFGIGKQIGLRWQSMLETFGRGKIVERARQHHADQLQDVDYMEQLVDAAVERRSFRKRFEEYRNLGGADFASELDQHIQGLTSSRELLENGDFQEGIKRIVDAMTFTDPMVIGKDAAGSPIEIPLTPANEVRIRSHLRFVLADEVIQMAQLSQMKVMQTASYDIGNTKPSIVASKLLGSGTLWGMGVRTGSKIVMGGALAAGTFSLAPLGMGVVAAAGVGALAGYTSQVMQYRYGRRVERKMDLALLGSNDVIDTKKRQVNIVENAEGKLEQITTDGTVKMEAVRHADELNVAMAQVSTELQKALDDLRVSSVADHVESSKRAAMVVCKAFTLTNEIELRLRQSRVGKDQQDFIAFGIKNRVAAQTELMKNARNLNTLCETTLQVMEREVYDFVSNHLGQIDYQNAIYISTIAKQLEANVLKKGEAVRRGMGLVLGGTFAGLASAAMNYASEYFSSHSIQPNTEPTFSGNAGIRFAHDGQTFTAAPDANGDLLVTNADGITTTVDVPAGLDIHNVVLDTDHMALFNAETGESVAHLSLEFTPADVADHFREMTLTANLSPNDAEHFVVNGNQFGVTVDKSGNLLIAKVLDGNKLDIEHPLQPPVDTISPALRTYLGDHYSPDEALKVIERAANFQMQSNPDGTVIIKSAFDGSEIVKFHVNPDGTVNTLAVARLPEPTPPGAGAGPDAAKAWVDKLFADPNSPVAGLLKKMGVEPGEITLKPDGTFDITDEAVKGEYLGATESWRQTRLELLLEALKDGKIPKDEPAEMIVARLERATNHLILNHDKYPNSDAAIDEAFGKSDAFIKEHALEWVKGPKSHISVRWEKLVDALRHHTESSNAAGTPAAATNTPEVGAPGAAAAVPAAEAAPTSAAEVLHQVGRETIFQDAVDAKLNGEVDTLLNSWVGEVAALAAGATLGSATAVLENTIKGSHLESSKAQAPLDVSLSRETVAASFSALDTERPDPEAGKIASIERKIDDAKNDYSRVIRAIELIDRLAKLNRWNVRGDLDAFGDIDELTKTLTDIKAEIPAGHPRTAELNDAVDQLSRANNNERVRLEECITKRNAAITEDINAKLEAIRREAEGSTTSPTRFTQLLLELLDLEPRLELLQEGYDNVKPNIKTIDAAIVQSAHQRVIDLMSGIQPLREQLSAGTTRHGELDPSDEVFADDTGGVEEDAEGPTPVAEPVDAEAARKRLAEAADAVEHGRQVDAWKAKMNRANALLTSRLFAEYGANHLNALIAITDRFEHEGILDQTHTAKWYNHLQALEGNGKARLERSGMIKASGEVDQSVINRVIERIKENPNESPF